jgi:hypothetical protein
MTGIVVQVGSCQVDPRDQDVIRKRGRGRLAHRAASIVAPSAEFFVPPAAVAKMANNSPMGPLAMFAAALGPLEPNHVRQLLPVDRVKPTMLWTDWHQAASFV